MVDTLLSPAYCVAHTYLNLDACSRMRTHIQHNHTYTHTCTYSASTRAGSAKTQFGPATGTVDPVRPFPFARLSRNGTFRDTRLVPDPITVSVEEPRSQRSTPSTGDLRSLSETSPRSARSTPSTRDLRSLPETSPRSSQRLRAMRAESSSRELRPLVDVAVTSAEEAQLIRANSLREMRQF